MKAIAPKIPLLEPVIYAKDQAEYEPLPACRTPDGEVVTRWKLTWWERINVLFGDDIFVTLLTFNQPLSPMRIQVDKPHYVFIPDEVCDDRP